MTTTYDQFLKAARKSNDIVLRLAFCRHALATISQALNKVTPEEMSYSGAFARVESAEDHVDRSIAALDLALGFERNAELEVPAVKSVDTEIIAHSTALLHDVDKTLTAIRTAAFAHTRTRQQVTIAYDHVRSAIRDLNFAQHAEGIS